MKRIRLDDSLVASGFARDAADAFVIVTEGRVLVNGQKAVSPAQTVTAEDEIDVRGGEQYVGRGALKLEAALKEFGISVQGEICADIGAATGGFTEVLLKNSAAKVYAIDTARGKLALKLRNDPRVIVMEGTDVRDLSELPEKVDLAAIDVSLIPLEHILPAVKKLLTENGIVIALLKPQYQTRNPEDLRHGIVKDDEVRKRILDRFRGWLSESGWYEAGFMESPIRGGEGNVEYLFLLKPIGTV